MAAMLRLITWASLFALPCWWLMTPYQHLLGRAVVMVLTAIGFEVEIDHVEVAAPLDLGFYAALCLATTRAPLRARWRAVLGGVPLVGALGVIVVAAGIASAAGLASMGMARGAERWASYLFETVPWINALVVWTVFLGPAVWRATRPLRRRRGAGGVAQASGA